MSAISDTFAAPLLPASPSDGAAGYRRIAWFLVACYAASCVYAYLAGRWLVDASGHPIAGDFLNVWAAGRMALEGNAAGAYDWSQHKAVQVLGVGQDFDVYFAWFYPPLFFLFAAPLALVPYVAGHLLWMAATLPLYAGAIRLIVGRSGALIAALAFPAALWNFSFGQNGFLTAALLGAGLALLRSRPLLAGVLFGLLAYKPHFGLLVPIALIAGGHWRTIAAAAATTLLAAGLATLLFGAATWPAFLASTELANQSVLVAGWAGFGELLSTFGAVRWLGGSVALAWTLQGALAAALAAAVWKTSRPGIDPSLGAATLAAACLMASPYSYIYDYVALAVAIAFLARVGCTPAERTIIGFACVLVLGGPLTETPLAALAAPTVLGIALRKALSPDASFAITRPNAI